MAKRRLNGIAKFERMFKILEYLKRNTDKEHPITQSEMRQDQEIAEYIGDKETFNRLIKDMANAMNSDEYGDKGYKPEEEWKIYFNDFKRYYDELDLELENEEEDEENYNDFLGRTMHLRNLYYNRTFSYDEINSLIEGILAARTIDTKMANFLIEKIENNLTTKFYKKGPRQICKVMEPLLENRELMRENLLTIQKAIDNNVQISFRFNGYTYQKKLEPVREGKDVVSPYYIVASGGRCYLLACMESKRNERQLRNMSIWRIDLMTDVEIPDANEKLNIYGKPRTPKGKVKNLPPEWSDDFQLKHLNMSFDEPEWITLRIKSTKRSDAPDQRVRPDYTFLHDWFGDSFQYVSSEKEAPYDDIVRVECSPYGMVNWAMQYSDRVEVIAPEKVREAVVEKVKNLNEKYNVERTD